jgi:23S rRNA (uracil1939-C5)-methyltransferase
MPKGNRVVPDSVPPRTEAPPAPTPRSARLERVPAPRGEPLVAEIESLDLEGNGVARVDGKVAFIAGALPGERVLWQRQRAKARFDTGQVVGILRASPLRTTPRCAHFGLAQGSCGGCSMQHLEARAQVSIKQRMLEESLARIGHARPEMVLRPVCGLPWNYRHRARLTVRYIERKGGVLVGFHERASSYVADLRSCPVLAPPVATLLLPLRALVGGLSIRDRLPQIEVAVAQDTTVLVLRILAPLTEDDRQRCRQFAAEHGVSLWIQPAGPDSAEPLDAGVPDHLALPLPEFGLELPFRPTDFTQVNHRTNEVLVRRAVALLAPEAGEVIADFFCGMGNFTLPLATRARRVLGLEGSAALLQRAGAAAHAAGLGDKVEFTARNLFEWSVQDWARLRQSAGGRIDRLLIDPPRDGALAVVQSLAGDPAPPRRIVYVSCNPATLARDCGWLVHEARWQLRAAGVVNMFPHTSHVESIAVLEPPEEDAGGAAGG